MKKVGIITLFDLNNFGNRLQNYAVKYSIEKLGYKCDTLRIIRENDLTIQKEFIKALIGKYKDNRFYKFYKFSKENTSYINIMSTKKVIPSSIEKQYDYFITGSDQVWNSGYLNPANKELVLKERLLAFTDSNKRITYAPSFSLDDIPEVDKPLFKKELSKFNKIGVRENKGKEIVNNLIKKDAEVILDPTLMLTKEEWLNVSKNKFKNKKDYILQCFIVNSSELAREKIKEISESNNLEIIDVSDEASKYYNIGPSEFIELVSKAKIICTDSFHAMVFSIIFEKPFIVFDRSDKKLKVDSRFDTLLSSLEIKNKLFKDGKEFNNELIFDSDYSQALKILEKKREKTMEFLKGSFN